MRYILSLLLLLFSNILMFSIDGEKKDSTILKKLRPTTRPSKPSSAEIICTYEDGVLAFYSEVEMLPMNVTISDSFGSSQEFVTLVPEIEISLEPGIYYICCQTVGNITFAGYIDISM